MTTDEELDKLRIELTQFRVDVINALANIDIRITALAAALDDAHQVTSGQLAGIEEHLKMSRLDLIRKHYHKTLSSFGNPR